MSRRTKNHKTGISHVFLFYWVVLAMWQNLGNVVLRSGFDLILKVCLILLLTAFYVLHTKSISKNIVIILLFALSLLLSFWLTGDSFSGSNLIAYIYPVLLAVLAFGLGNDFQINKKEFVSFLNGIIVVCLVAAGYAVIFQTDYFLTAFMRKLAYGYELTSFFLSSHEYGMYLVYAIVACAICIELKRNEPRKKKIFYIISLAVLIPNLLLTFSRTSLLAMAVSIFIYCLFNANTNLRKWIIFGIVVLVVAMVAVDEFRNLIDLVIFKGYNGQGLGDREELYQFAITMFEEGNVAQKLFGYGIGVRSIFEMHVGHKDVHNAYLQVLMYFGITGLVFFMGFLLSQLQANIRLCRQSKFYATMFSIFLIAAMTMMFTNTAVVFTSPTDSFFLTVVAILVPKYVRNAICIGNYDI